jgi:hypothetical protein
MVERFTSRTFQSCHPTVYTHLNVVQHLHDVVPRYTGTVIA